jgi:succinate dehydrogenase flavin-adding protein (antitoxin of CptAB toxin-antitoxin module)
MKELDILLERYARAYLPAASVEQCHVFEQFLQLPDPVLADYLLAACLPERPEWAQLVGQILGHASGRR